MVYGMNKNVYTGICQKTFYPSPLHAGFVFLFTSGMAYMVYLFVKNQNKRMESNMLQYRLEKEKELYEQKISFYKYYPRNPNAVKLN